MSSAISPSLSAAAPPTLATASTAEEMRRAVTALRAGGEAIGFVPTMGALHEGHLSLVRLARSRGARVVASVFVNPSQFGPGEDFERYPRQAETDSALLAGTGCDLLFLPAVETIYPPGHATRVHVEGAALGLEGDCRPGHFAGVATVVLALCELVRPDFAVFGEKDAQQLAVIRQLGRDFHLPVEIVAGPTVREPDGLAMSSRNAYLKPAERAAASVIYRALASARTAIAAGERRAESIRALLHAALAEEPLFTVDYAEVVDGTSFRPLERLAGYVVLAVAGRLGQTRLLDNFQLHLPPAAPGDTHLDSE